METGSSFDFLVKRIRDYIPLSGPESDLVKALFTEEQFGKNEVILQEGEVCRRMYFIAEGLLRFSRLADGVERTYVFRAEGAFCNDMESFLKKAPSVNSITTIEPTTVLSITHDNLEVFYNQLQYGDRFGRLAIEQIFVTVVRHLTGFYAQTPRERYEIFAGNYGPLMQRIPQYYIASYIGVTPQALCRIKKKLLGKA